MYSLSPTEVHLDELTVNVFFQVVSKRYEQGSMILTSNKFYIARIGESIR
ncbi:ATP-binding protein [Parageobacillus genomosp. 1]|nr:ATP-binding protein [Parageobacillus genomosp. 1]